MDDANGILRKMIPSKPASPCCLIMLAAACDMFHAAKNVIFLSNLTCNAFIKSRVHIFAQKLGQRFWKKLSSEFPPPARHNRPRRSTKRRKSATSLFCLSSPGPPAPGLGKCIPPGLTSLNHTNIADQLSSHVTNQLDKTLDSCGRHTEQSFACGFSPTPSSGALAHCPTLHMKVSRPFLCPESQLL